MPVVNTNPFPLAGDITAYARALVNDMAESVAGDILADSQPYTFILLQGGYEYLQDRLIENGVETYSEEADIIGLTAVANSDPSVEVYLSFDGYFDGHTTFATPALPADLLTPLRLWERQSGTQNLYTDMVPVADAIASQSQTSRFYRWDWRQDKIFLPGCTQLQDLRVRYLLYAPSLIGPTSPVLVARAKEALGYLLAEKACEARGSTFATSFHAKAELAIERMINRSTQKRQRISYRRKPFRVRRSH